MVQGTRLQKSKPLTELNVEGKFTEDRTVWTEELQRLCKEQFDDEGGTTVKPDGRTEKYKKAGDRHFTEAGRIAEISPHGTAGESQDGGRKSQRTRPPLYGSGRGAELLEWRC